MAYEAVIYEKKDHVAFVTLNRPEALNAFNNTMHNELYDIWQDVMKDDNVRVVVITGTGRAFSSGADMKEAAGGQRKREHMGIPGRDIPMDRPIVCAINGIIGGTALIMMGACDIIIASENAQFLDPHVSVGWIPLSETFSTATHMPFGMAMRMALMGTKERMSAQRAYEVGLVSEVVPPDKLMQRATEIAQAVAENAPLATRAIKRAMRAIFIEGPYRENLEKHAYLHVEVNQSEDGKEGPRAFAQKRKAEWKGR